MALGANIHALAGDAGTALKADTLRKEPYADAKTVGSLAKNDSVEILSKKGAWLQVKSKKSTGWVRLLSVKRGAASSSGSSVADIASGRSWHWQSGLDHGHSRFERRRVKSRQI